MYIRARAREDTAGVRMRGALSARTILTRSHVCAGVSVRFFFRSALSARSFFVTSLRFGRYASGACVCVHTCGVREFHAPGGCICDLLRVHVHVIVLRVRDFFFEAHSPLRSAARETTLWVGSASLPKLHNFSYSLFWNFFARASTSPQRK